MRRYILFLSGGLIHKQFRLNEVCMYYYGCLFTVLQSSINFFTIYNDLNILLLANNWENTVIKIMFI